MPRMFLSFCCCPCWCFFFFFNLDSTTVKKSFLSFVFISSVGLGHGVFFPFNMSSILSNMLFICNFLGNFSLFSFPETALYRLYQFYVFSTCPISFPSRFITSYIDWIPCFMSLEEKGLSPSPFT